MTERQPLLSMTLSQLDFDVLTRLLADLTAAGWDCEVYLVQPDFSELMTAGLRIMEMPPDDV